MLKKISAFELADGMTVMSPFSGDKFTVSGVRHTDHFVYFVYTLNHKPVQDRMQRSSQITIDLGDDYEKPFLVCRNCGEAFEDLDVARDHGASDPNTKSWCGDDGFDIVPESEAF